MSKLKKAGIITGILSLISGTATIVFYGVRISSSTIAGEDSNFCPLPCIGVALILLGMFLLSYSLKEEQRESK